VPTGTCERILDAAEELFAERGILATSLRVLTKAAGVNLAAVHYHFGSKQALLDAVLERRAKAVNLERLASLARMEALAEGRQLHVAEILSAFVLPGARSLEALPDRGALLGRLRARVEAQPPEVVQALFRKHFGDVCARFLEALQQALPELDAELVSDRFRLTLGTLSCAFSGNLELDTIPGHPPSSARIEVKVQRLIEFLAAGLQAPDSTRLSVTTRSAVATRGTSAAEPSLGENPC
jgi:AcrR family transcriptional regulator